MYINTGILIQHLKKQYHVFAEKNLRNTTFCSLRIYGNNDVTAHHLYLIRPEQLVFLNIDDIPAVFLCTGIQEKPSASFQQDVILIRETVDFGELLNIVNEIFDFYNTWEAQLIDCINEENGIQLMLDKSEKALPGTLILGDYFFNHIAYTRDFSNDCNEIRKRHHGKTPSYVSEEILTDSEYCKVQNSREVFRYPVHKGDGSTRMALNYNLFTPGEKDFRGRLILITAEQSYSPEQEYLLAFLGDKINRIFSRTSLKSTPVSIYNSLREIICNCIRRKNASESLLSSILGNLGWKLADSYLLIKFVPYFLHSKEAMNALACNQIELMYPESCSVIFEDSVILLINLSRGSLHMDDVLHDRLAFFLREHLYKAGLSTPFQSFTNIYYGFQEASAALEYGNVRHSMLWYYKFSDYALDYMIHTSSQNVQRRSLCHQSILRLMEYDTAHNTMYAQSLETYMRCQYNVSHAAEALYIHRTTLLKHLAKISQMTGLDLDDWKTRIHLMLSFWILENK